MIIHSRDEIRKMVADALAPDNWNAKLDLHCHLFPPQADSLRPGKPPLCRYGVIQALRYHYVRRDMLKRLTPERQRSFQTLSDTAQAHAIWKELFAKRDLVLDEARLSVWRLLKQYGLSGNSFQELLDFDRSLTVDGHIGRVFKEAGIASVIMTNNPFDADELEWYEKGEEWDPRFQAALRLDDLVLKWPKAKDWMNERLGCNLDGILGTDDIEKIKKFIVDWAKKLKVKYLAVSLPPTFNFDAEKEDTLNLSNLSCRILKYAVMKVARELRLPLFLMVEVERGLSSHWGDAGDSLGKIDIAVIREMARYSAETDGPVLWTTPLNYNTHAELTALAASTSKIVPWGIWWYNLQPEYIRTITAARMQTLAENFWPMHSDARVIDHEIPKWLSFIEVWTDLLTDRLVQAQDAGLEVTFEGIKTLNESFFNPQRLKLWA